jgi:alpha-D-ribose 1-methylphosphonate 5-triphosphate synthase subunit PhnL
LLDEPTASLDREARASLTGWLADLKQRSVAMIGIFHHPEEVQHLIDDEIQLTAPDSADLGNMLTDERDAYVVE